MCSSDLLDMGNWSSTKSFGMSDEADYSIISNDENLHIKEGDVLHGNLSPKLFGKHNLMNIISAFSALRSIGFEGDKILDAINQFNGVKRRLQQLDQFISHNVFDDFAHHPTAIKYGINAIKERFPDQKLCVLAELASNTMRKGTLKDEVVNSFSEADYAFISASDDFEWDIEHEFGSHGGVDIVKSNQDLMNKLASIDTDEVNFLIMTNKSSVPFINALESRI